MLGAGFGGDGEDSKSFSEHRCITPEVVANSNIASDGSPDGGTGGDRIDAAENGVTDIHSRPKAVVDGVHDDRGVNLSPQAVLF